MSTMTRREALTTAGRESSAEVEALRLVLPKLTDRDQNFAGSLLKQNDRRGLSEKQMFWVRELTKRATEPKPEPAKAEVGAGIEGVVQLLNRAKQHLKYPKLMIRVNGQDLRLSVAGPKARAPGSVNVTNCESYANRTWYGRVANGEFEASLKSTPETNTAIVAALRALAADPAGVASEYGKLTGVCCFCSIPLTDERSTAVGYGAVCASHYGLPWGTPL